ncbi:GFA family protein [Vibrio sp. AND4]|uniref:GFA family protein n=1 Tax=Vibrio sp. AND4 TaxID=314289 RepID=UPI00015F34A3|nr:GFA family protein [Vibrio sp. AND4]EDP59494.1 hypothetical protein AND4_10069 [Vibrio sp. AND4]
MLKITHTCECACGLVQLRCTAEPIRTSIYRCFECQKRTGSVFGVQARFHKEQITLDGDVTSYTRVTESGNHIQYDFCPACGTTMRLSLSIAPDDTIIPIGLFNNKEFSEPTVSVYEQKKRGWVSFDCTMQHMV